MATSDRPARARLDALGSTAHLAGSGAGLLALLAGFAATQHPLVAVGTSAVGYLSGYLLCPGRPRTPAPLPGTGGTGAGDGAAEARAGLEAAGRALEAPGLPADVGRAGRDVLDVAAEVLGRWDRLDPLSTDARTVQTVLAEHLPAAVAAYRDVAGGPAGSGEQRARTEVLEQLVLLRTAVAGVRERLQRRAEEDLAVHGDFLRDKFSRGALDLGPVRDPRDLTG
ncbi:hypothetical protein [Kineococcus auxinigenes]|uniref:hypothetical protein n=1 Tax=unclassified Kineococcus TaxID=2621656 RepID=UPI003D7ED5A4